MNQPSKLEGMISMNVDLEKEKQINYLVEYSSYLFKGKVYDESILNWQAENSSILKPMGLDYEFMKKVKKLLNDNSYFN